MKTLFDFVKVYLSLTIGNMTSFQHGPNNLHFLQNLNKF